MIKHFVEYRICQKWITGRMMMRSRVAKSEGKSRNERKDADGIKMTDARIIQVNTEICISPFYPEEQTRE